MAPKVSIIVPCYGVEKYLDRCLESLVNQTLQDIEIILVDDKSPDCVPVMCEAWAARDFRITVVHKNENEGLGYARNTGLSYAHGEYVAFLDSDDWIELDMMDRLYKECKKENLDIIYSEFNVDEYPGYRIFLQPEQLYVGKEQIERLRLDILGAEPSYISSVKFQCSACKGLYRKKLIDKFELRFLSEREFISEDILFNLDVLLLSDRVKTVPWQFYHYCRNDASLTHVYRFDRWEKLLKMLEVLNAPNMYSDAKEFRLRLARTSLFYSYLATCNATRRPETTKEQILKEIQKIVNNKNLQSYIKCYPIYKLPIKWLIYSVALKLKLKRLLYVISGGVR